MSEEDFAALKDQVKGLKLALTKIEAEAQQTDANIELMEHLAGEARREIRGGGEGNEIKSNPDQIFAVLLRVFGDGDSLPQLQEQFFSYRQKEVEDLVSCSLKKEPPD